MALLAHGEEPLEATPVDIPGRFSWAWEMFAAKEPSLLFVVGPSMTDIGDQDIEPSVDNRAALADELHACPRKGEPLCADHCLRARTCYA